MRVELRCGGVGGGLRGRGCMLGEGGVGEGRQRSVQSWGRLILSCGSNSGNSS